MAGARQNESDGGAGGGEVGGGADVVKQMRERFALVAVPAVQFRHGADERVGGFVPVEPRREPDGGVLQGRIDFGARTHGGEVYGIHSGPL